MEFGAATWDTTGAEETGRAAIIAAVKMSPTSGCGMMKIPASLVVACVVLAMANVKVYTPISGLVGADTVRIVAFVALKIPAELAVPAIVIWLPGRGTFP
jgi:hypothetical protein